MKRRTFPEQLEEEARSIDAPKVAVSHAVSEMKWLANGRPAVRAETSTLGAWCLWDRSRKEILAKVPREDLDTLHRLGAELAQAIGEAHEEAAALEDRRRENLARITEGWT